MNAIGQATSQRAPQRRVRLTVLIFGTLISIASAWLGLQASGPLQQAMRMHAENDALERKIVAQEIQNQENGKKMNALATEQGKMIAARSRGYMLPNERPLHVRNDGSE